MGDGPLGVGRRLQAGDGAMTFALRDYQRAAVDAVWAYWRRGGGNALVEVPTGGGKSAILGQLAREVVEAGSRVLIATHRRELIEQDAAACRSVWPEAPIGIYSAGLGSRQVRAITVAGIQSIRKRARDMGDVGVLVIDECFTAATMVSTPTGPCRIDNVRPGDYVRCATGVGRVVAVRCRPATNIVTVRLSDGRKIRCTPDHRWLTSDGWTRADDMEGKSPIDEQTLRALWSVVRANATDGVRHGGAIVERARVLLSILCEEIQEPDEQPRFTGEDARDVARNKTHADQARRERAAVAIASNSIASCIGGGVGVGSCNPDEKGEGLRVPDLFQGRHWESDTEDRNRNRRRVTRLFVSPRARRKKSGPSDLPWVVSVSREQPGSVESVFNLHVDKHPSFFADGWLVHNCHLVSTTATTGYQLLIEGLREQNPEVRVVGLTATPYRLGQGYLTTGKDKLFDSIVYRVAVRDLIERGHLSPLTTGAASTAIDTSDVGTSGGEFVLRDLELASDVDSINDSVAQDVINALANGRTSALLFGVSVAHATRLCWAVRARGVSCEVVTGETDQGERKKILARFKAREIQAIASCDVLTTGFDAPVVDTIALVRPTKSTSLYVQMLGRGMRVAAGKIDCIVLDYGGNIARHGPVDDVRVPAPKGEGDGTAPIKFCPDCCAEVPAAARECPECGHAFPEVIRKANQSSSKLAVLSSTTAPVAPVRTKHKVGEVKWTKHEKRNDPSARPTLRLDYYSDGVGLKIASEWVCLEHDEGSYAWRKAQEWWARNVGGNMASPSTIDAAVALLDDGHMPTVVEIETEPDGAYTRVVRVIQARPREPGADAADDDTPIVRAIGLDDEELLF